MADGLQAAVGERGAALQVQAGHPAQRGERAQAVIYECHMPPAVQAQRPAQPGIMVTTGGASIFTASAFGQARCHCAQSDIVTSTVKNRAAACNTLAI